MGRTVCFAATQFPCQAKRAANVDIAEALIRAAAAAGAQIICLQELFESFYIGQKQDETLFVCATSADSNPSIKRFSKVAAELKVVIAVPFFERAGNVCFNSVMIIDADGQEAGLYRKSHIPDGPGYQEKFYFAPGNTGFKTFDTKYARIGIAICWDQWFPEAARALALQGAEVILYPSAIGTEPHDPSINSYAHWVTVQRGHAAANLVPIVVSNRIGTETYEGSEAFEKSRIHFYGGSFICGIDGGIVSQVGALSNENGNPDPKPKLEEGFCLGTFDLDELAQKRLAWGLFRDRRPELYAPLLKL